MADRNNPEHPSGGVMDYHAPPAGGPPPPSISHSGSGGGSGGSYPPTPPYMSSNPAKYPPRLHYRPGNPGEHRYHAPTAQVPAPESRYPPSSSARHEDYARHPPPPPHAHYGRSYYAPPPTAAPTAQPAVIRPHPADRFGKTITVSSRENIDDPPTWTHAPRVGVSPRVPPPPPPTVHFSPSRGGAFQPYRPTAGRQQPYPSNLRQPQLVPRDGSKDAVEVFEINPDAEDNAKKEMEESDEEVKAVNEKNDEAQDEDKPKDENDDDSKEAANLDQGKTMSAVTHSTSMESNEVPTGKDEGDNKEGKLAAFAEGPTEFKERLKPAPITTTALKRPRSANGGDVVNVDDDTPKHINISHASGSKPGSFHYPPKRSKLSEDMNDPSDQYTYPPDISEMHQEDRQDKSNREQYQYSQRDGYPYHDYPGPALSRAPSQGSLGIRGSWTTPNSNNPMEYPEPASYLNAQSMSWEVPAGTLSAIGSTLSFGFNNNASSSTGGEFPSLKASPSLKMSPIKKREVPKDMEGMEEDDIPPLPSTGSNLPPRKRALLAPRPGGPSSKLFEPPPPTTSGERTEKTLEARGGEVRDPTRESKYAPTTVHDPRERRQMGYSYDRRDPYHDARYQDYERRDPYESPMRYPQGEYTDQHKPAAPWGSPPRSQAHALPALHDTSHHNTIPEGGSFESKGSFRSLDDLDEPVDSLLYRPSFSWERGLDSAPSSTGYRPPSRGHHHSSGPHGGYAGYGPPPPTHSSYFGGYPPIGGPPEDSGIVQLRSQQKIMKALAMRGEVRTIGDPNSPVGLILLLAMPQDRHCLSETLCIVRNNVEVFTATEEDLNAPAPGRKRPIQLGQVGLRCVYCRMCNQKDRVKRATCFPSSMKRIYRAVIDMKLDHFKHCPMVPPGLKSRLDELKQGSTRSTGMTVQYFVKSAAEIGMVDVDDGVTIDLRRVNRPEQGYPALPPPRHQQMVPYPQHHYRGGYGQAHPKQKSRGRQLLKQSKGYAPQAPVSSHGAPPPLPPPSGPFRATGAALVDPQGAPPVPGLPSKRFSGRTLLALPCDTNYLSPLRCFLRENVCAFTASERDIAVRTPTTFSVRVGQVGVGCIHCLAVPPKCRSNRAVCFPFTISRIYQSVADIQRFHLAECKMMPPHVREMFLKLQAESAKGSRGLATRTYWIDSARKIGLADGPNGMYFCRDPSLPPPPDISENGGPQGGNLGVLAQAASGEESITKVPLVTPEDRPTIAEFLYLVMEQLRPTRFSEADRNKRRSKDVGSIGVECRHCAGKIDGRKFFWSSVSAAESNFVSVHSHMLKCKYIPDPLKEELARLKELRREQTSRLKTGSQKAFFTRVWARLHGTPVPAILAIPSPGKAKRAGKGVKGKYASATPALPKLSKPAAADDSALELQRNDSDEIRALLESKSTLSSMPSVDDSVAARQAAEDQDMELGCLDSELKTRFDESSGKNIVTQGSKGSLTSVARNMSAVTVHCKEEEQKADAAIAEV